MNTENIPSRIRTAFLSLHAERHGSKVDFQPMGTRGKVCGWLPGSVLRRWLALFLPSPHSCLWRAEGTAGTATVSLEYKLHDCQVWAMPGSLRTTEPVQQPWLPMFTQRKRFLFCLNQTCSLQNLIQLTQAALLAQPWSQLPPAPNTLSVV